MNKAKFFFASALLCAGLGFASNAQDFLSIDTTAVQQLNESIVSAVKVSANAPFAVSNIDRKALEDFSKKPQELPYLFSKTPGVLAWGENGLGTGTSYLRIRGAGDSRINVTLDGVSLNSPEDQCVFWANMNSYASFLGGVQIQRGVGASTNGDGAFGGSIILSTKTPSFAPSADFSVSYGSYNSFKTNLAFSSGLIKDMLVIDGGFSISRTDGYVNGTGGNGGNWIVGLHLFAKDNLVIRYRNIGNVEHSGQAWNGVVAGNNDLSLMDGTYGAETGIRTYADMYKAGLGRFNNLYEYLVTDEDGNFVQDENGRYLTARYEMNDGSYWKRTSDNFTQNHNILSMAWAISENWDLNASLHYTYGYGYYDEFRPDNKLKKFGITDLWNAKGKTTTDFVRQKGLSQHKYGALVNSTFTADGFRLNMGLNAQNFNANHFGYLTYIADNSIRQDLQAPWYKEGDSKLQYYNSDAVKTDVSAFVKANYDITSFLSAYADVQYRFVHFKTWGINDKFVTAQDGSSKTGPWVNQSLDIRKNYNFLNPKLGLDFHYGAHNAFASVAISNREPERNNFTDNGKYDAPVPEMVMDYELGYNYNSSKFQAAATLYFMDYRNQFVQTGEVSDIGENLTTNIAKSYRMGIELSAAYSPARWFTVDGTLALSRNRLQDFNEVVEDWDNWDSGYTTIHYSNTPLAFSPSVVGGINFTFRFLKGASATWSTNAVSRQYLDNTGCKERSLPAYTFTNIDLAYTLEVGKKWMRSVDFGLNLGNIFNSHYAQSGWVYSAIAESYGHGNDNRYYQIGFIPAAGFTAMGSVALHF